jgi:hypothetical protein
MMPFVSDDQGSVGSEPDEDGIIWATTLPGTDHVPKWVAILTPFRKRPGLWGTLPGTYENAVATASRLRNDPPSGVKRGQYDFEARPDPTSGKMRVWVRYNGDAE